MTHDFDALFRPLDLGRVTIRNRIAMAPMTRQRSTLAGVPTPLNVEHYRQRANAGLIVTEGIAPCAMGVGYLFAPGLYDDAQEEGWRQVAAAVHDAGGALFGQVMHVGRLSDPLMLDGRQPASASAVRPDPLARHYTVSCPRPKRPYPEPRAMTHPEILETIDAYRACAQRALAAGLDGVEIHAASGYLPDQFLCSNTNLRTDQWGGSVEKRAAFLLACVDAMSEVAGPRFVAVKLSPGWTFHDVFDANPVATYSHVARELSKRDIAYLQLGDYGVGWDVCATLRPLFDRPIMAVGGLTRSGAAALLAEGTADIAAFGQAWIANPDLAERYRGGQPLNRPDIATYYTQGSEGYTDYPAYSEALDSAIMQPVDALPTRLSADVTG